MLRIATWNINSVRLRVRLVTRFLDAYTPDVLCLQEIKCRNDAFPAAPFKKRGYSHLAINGQKGYHGVAIVSRVPLADISIRGFCSKDDARHIAASVATPHGAVRIHNFYVPAGGDEPDPAANEKFAHKLAFVAEMRHWLAARAIAEPSVLLGDLNIAPLEHDVWSHRQLLKVVSHTPLEVEGLEGLRTGGGWTDVARHFVPHNEKLYTWWSYRALDWEAADRGRRLDHIWVTGPLVPHLDGIEIVRQARGWKRPSDHVPVIASIR